MELSKGTKIKMNFNKEIVYDLLMKGADFSNVKSVCFYMMCSPYYANRFKSEHPSIDVKCIEEKECQSMFKDVEGITYTDDDSWPNIANSFDYIFHMNKPGGNSGCVKDFSRMINHTTIIKSLSPIEWLDDIVMRLNQNSIFNKNENVRSHIENIYELPKQLVADIMGIVKNNFGIYTINSVATYDFADKFIWRGPKNESIFNKIVSFCERENMFPHVDNHQLDGIRARLYSLARYNSTNDNMHYCVVPRSYSNLIIDGKLIDGSDWRSIHHTYRNAKGIPCSVKFDDIDSAINFIDCMKTPFMVYTVYISVQMGINFKMIPWVGNSRNRRTGKVGFDSTWTNNDLMDLFGLTDSEKEVINNFI